VSATDAAGGGMVGMPSKAARGAVFGAASGIGCETGGGGSAAVGAGTVGAFGTDCV
jgi:hypothetical protein